MPGVVGHLAADGAGQASRERQSEARSVVSVAGIGAPARLEECPANDARYAGSVVGDVDADAAGVLPPRSR